VGLFLGDAERGKLDPILDACVAVYKDKLDEDGQVDFKGKATKTNRFGRGQKRPLSLAHDMSG
jgi:type I restriction enzyme R subunit